jgi:hypothetical protein
MALSLTILPITTAVSAPLPILRAGVTIPPSVRANGQGAGGTGSGGSGRSMLTRILQMFSEPSCGWCGRWSDICCLAAPPSQQLVRNARLRCFALVVRSWSRMVLVQPIRGKDLYVTIHSTNRRPSVFYRFLSTWYVVLRQRATRPNVDRPHYFGTDNSSVGVCSLHLLSAELASPGSGLKTGHFVRGPQHATALSTTTGWFRTTYGDINARCLL